MKSILLMTLVVLVGLGTACEFSVGDDTATANKFIDEAATLHKAYADDHGKAEKLRAELFGAELQEAEDFAAYKEQYKAKFAEYQSTVERIEKTSSDTIGKLESAAKTKITGPFKEYIDVKVQETKKRNEADKAEVTFVKAMMAENDLEKVSGLVQENRKKIAAAIEEAGKLQEKAATIVKNNPEAISGK